MVTVAEGEKLEVNLELSAAGLAGRVVDESTGAGLLGVQVAVEPEAAGAGLHLFTRPDGSFSIASLPAGNYRLSVKKPGFGARCLGPLEVEADRVASAGEIVLSPGAALEVSVRDSVGRPIGGAEAILTPRECGARGARRAAAGGDGLARFADLGEGSADLEARAGGYPPAAATVSLVSGRESKTTIHLRLVGDLSVAVRDSKGAPVSGASVELIDEGSSTAIGTWVEAGFVSLEPTSGKTGNDGTLVVRDLPHGRYTVRVQAPGIASWTGVAEVRAPQNSLVVE